MIPGWYCTNSPNMPSFCVSKCGDGIWVGNEGCDDGNTVSGDGCDSTC